MRPLTSIMISAAITVTLLVAAAPLVAPYGRECTVCHAGSNPSSGFRFTMPHLVFSAPMAAPPNWTMEVMLSVHHPGYYIMNDLKASLAVKGDGSIVYFEQAQKSLPSVPSSGGRASCRWTIVTGNVSGTVSLSVRLNFTAHYNHAGNAQDNDGSFSLTDNRDISVRPTGLFSTEGYLMMGGEGPSIGVFGVISGSPVRNITIRLSGNLRSAIGIVPTFIGGLGPGKRQDINVSLEEASGAVSNGRIDIAWENETGFRDSTFIMVDIMATRVVPAPPGSGTLRVTGRLTGMLSLGLLITSIVLGAVKAGGTRRVRIHCAISWFIVGLALYHGLMLVWGPYSRVMWGNFLVLGYASAAVMGVSGANGLLQGWMSRKTGHKTWLWMHRITLVLAVVLVMIHALAIGTDFSAIRSLLGRG